MLLLSQSRKTFSTFFSKPQTTGFKKTIQQSVTAAKHLQPLKLKPSSQLQQFAATAKIHVRTKNDKNNQNYIYQFKEI